MDDDPIESELLDYELLKANNLPTSFGKSFEYRESINKAWQDKMLASTKRIEINDGEEENLGPSSSTFTAVDYPISHQLQLSHHEKNVSVIEIEENGTRMITCSHDYSMSWWEWSGMDGRLLPFRSIEPSMDNSATGGLKLDDCKFSPDGKLVIIGSSASHKPKLYDRHGGEVREYSGGDPYLRDLRRTGGHVAGIKSVGWKGKDRFWTAGLDGTIRTWNPDQHLKSIDTLIIKGTIGMSKCPITVAKLYDENTFCASTTDGHFRFIDVRSGKITLDYPNAHLPNMETSGLAINSTKGLVATRGGDNTVKVWDMRNSRQPILERKELDNAFSQISIVWNPLDNNTLLTGTSVKKGGSEKAKLVFINLDRENDFVIPMENYSISALNWPASLNQIFIGQANGTVSILYDPEKSHKGILLPISRQPTLKVQAIYENEIGGPIMIPFQQNEKTALRVETDYGFGHNSEIPYSDVVSALKRTTKAGYCPERHDPIKSHKPDPGIEGPGRGGRLGSTITQSIMKSVLAERNKQLWENEDDPRKAILDYAELAEKDPYFITPAYKQSQPVPILNPNLLLKEEEAQKKKQQVDEIKGKKYNEKEQEQMKRKLNDEENVKKYLKKAVT